MNGARVCEAKQSVFLLRRILNNLNGVCIVKGWEENTTSRMYPNRLEAYVSQDSCP